METRAGDPGAFARFDLSRVDTPAFVVGGMELLRNLVRAETQRMQSSQRVFSDANR